MARRYLVAYVYTPRGTAIGQGRAFLNLDGPLTQEAIEAMEEKIERSGGFRSVAIVNLIEMEWEQGR